MARSHHRKKHREHLQQFRHIKSSATPTAKGKASGIFGIVGAVAGLAISFIATNGTLLFVAIGTVAGAVAGYFIGKRADNADKD